MSKIIGIEEIRFMGKDGKEVVGKRIHFHRPPSTLAVVSETPETRFFFRLPSSQFLILPLLSV